LVEYVAALQPSLRLHNSKLKYLLKKAAVDLLPAEILTRKKQGFAMPMDHWFRNDLAGFAREVLESKRAQERDIFNPHFVHHLLQQHQNAHVVNHSSAIWSL